MASWNRSGSRKKGAGSAWWIRPGKNRDGWKKTWVWCRVCPRIAGPEETSYIDQDEEREQVLVIADYPARDPEAVSDIPTFVTQPVGVVMMKGCIVTIAGEENEPVSELESGRTRVNTTQKTRLLLLLLLAISQRFLYCLRQIDRLSNQTEARLYKSMKNRELLHMLQLDKSLVYFSSS